MGVFGRFLQRVHGYFDTRRRRRRAGVRPGQVVRDPVSDGLYRVQRIEDATAGEYTVDGNPLDEVDRNAALECRDDLVVTCRPVAGDDERAFPHSRLDHLALDAGDQARDRFTGNVFTVRRIRDDLASSVDVDGQPLADYDLNQRLDCAEDLVVDCTYPGSSKTYAFPLSRVVPGTYATTATTWKDRVTSTRECFSCVDGVKDRETQSVCADCRARIFARDDGQCQQQGCGATDDLQIHHLHYEPNGLGLVPDRYLIVLCRDCHEARHGIK